jgi:D-alanyl-D-alanine carboxypeptidase/D-alanyl-D-alanine-endopeptidase (penicillin-binding protein 4)
MPASTLKLVTLAAAVRRLGWEYAFETRIRTTAPIGPGGVLHGDLVVEGTGDPTLDRREDHGTVALDEWANRLWDAGLRTIDGRVVGDDRAFEPPHPGRGWSWDDLAFGFAAPIGALQINSDAARLDVRPATTAGLPAGVSLTPEESGLIVMPQVVTGAPDSPARLGLERLPGDPVVRIWGTVPAASAPLVRFVAVANPTDYFVRLFAAALARRGIAITRGAADIDDLPAGAVRTSGGPLVVRRSPPLREIARVMLKSSDNLYAETLLRALGRVEGRPATTDDGLAAVGSVLAEWGIGDGALVQADGSGLSPYNLATAGLLTAVLRQMFSDAAGRDAWLDALPVGGGDGTLRSRFRGTAAAGRVRAKTGTLTNVRALAGYVQAAGGEWIAFAILVNNSGSGRDQVDEVTDRAVERIAAFRR